MPTPWYKRWAERDDLIIPNPDIVYPEYGFDRQMNAFKAWFNLRLDAFLTDVVSPDRAAYLRYIQMYLKGTATFDDFMIVYIRYRFDGVEHGSLLYDWRITWGWLYDAPGDIDRNVWRNYINVIYEKGYEYEPTVLDLVPEGYLYVGSRNSDVFHPLNATLDVSRIKTENLVFYRDWTDAISKGKRPSNRIIRQSREIDEPSQARIPIIEKIIKEADEEKPMGILEPLPILENIMGDVTVRRKKIVVLEEPEEAEDSATLGSITTTDSKTIASGVITITKEHPIQIITLDTESAGAVDDLDTIDGGTEGMILILQSTADARDPTIKDAVDNIQTSGDFTLTNTDDKITLVKSGTDWHEISNSNNA